VIVRVVDIGEMDVHHCLNFIFITYDISDKLLILNPVFSND